MRLLFFPFDLINYLCGVFKIPLFSYTLATIACIPGTAIFVLAGAAFYGEEVTSLSQIAQNVNYMYLYLSVFFFFLSIIVSRYLRKKYQVL